MKKLKLILVMLLLFIAADAFAQTRVISQEDALSIVQAQFVDRDVDYYLMEKFDGSTDLSVWQIFVDAEPLQGWEHECYAFTIEKFQTGLSLPQKRQLRMPPADSKLIPLSVNDRYGRNATNKPYLLQSSINSDLTNAGNPALRTFAIILSGGYSPSANHERYWNDCSFIYQTLRKGFNVPKHNIYTIMSDGTDPGIDMFGTDYTYKSSPLDLDFDGSDDIRYSASLENVSNVIEELTGIMRPNDHLLFYVIDHGGRLGNNSYINLWGDDRLYDYHMAEMLTPLSDKGVNINILLGQCYSGGFIDDLRNIDCVVATACSADEMSYGCQNIPYDEFVYRWTCAVNQISPMGQIIPSDTNGDGSITMGEAFHYASRFDTCRETPQFEATLGALTDLSFDKLTICTADMFVRDNVDDYGEEPNLTTDIFWDSPDVWVRNEDDSIHWNEHPYYTDDHDRAYIYVRVHNRGGRTYRGGKFVIAYWAVASTGITVKAWKGLELYNGIMQTGGALRGAVINGPIAPGESELIRIKWGLPDDLCQADDPEAHHFCICARISDSPADEKYDPQNPTFFDVQASRLMAQRNVTLITSEELAYPKNVFMRNVHSGSHTYTLEVRPRTTEDGLLFTNAEVRMQLPQSIYDSWVDGGSQSESVSEIIALPRTLKLQTSNSSLKNIELEDGALDQVAIKFNFRTIGMSADNSAYTFDLIQRDETGKIVGGETYVVESPRRSMEVIAIDTLLKGNVVQLEAHVPDTYATSWYDENDNFIGNGTSIDVRPMINNKTFSVVAFTPEGELAGNSITLPAYTGVRSVTPEGSVQESIEIEFFDGQKFSTALVSISSLAEGTQYITVPVVSGQKSVSIDTSSLRHGMYVMTCIMDGETVFAHKFTKN